MRRVVSLAVAGTVALASIAGCGGEPEAPAAAGKPSAPSANLTLAQVTKLFGEQLKKDATVKAALTMVDGDDGEKTAGTLVLRDAGGFGHEMDLKVSSPNSPDGPGEMHAIILKDADYVSGVSEDPAKPWIKVPRGTKNRMLLLVAAPATLLYVAGDLRTPMALAAAGGTLTKTAPERAGAVDATRYTLTVQDVKKTVAAMPEGTLVSLLSPAARAGIEGLSGAARAKAIATARANLVTAQGGGQTVLDLWVGADGRPVKYARTDSTTKQPSTLELTFSDWGKAAVAVPPAAQIAENPTAGLTG